MYWCAPCVAPASGLEMDYVLTITKLHTPVITTVVYNGDSYFLVRWANPAGRMIPDGQFFVFTASGDFWGSSWWDESAVTNEFAYHLS